MSMEARAARVNTEPDENGRSIVSSADIVARAQHLLDWVEVDEDDLEEKVDAPESQEELEACKEAQRDHKTTRSELEALIKSTGGDDNTLDTDDPVAQRVYMAVEWYAQGKRICYPTPNTAPTDQATHDQLFAATVSWDKPATKPVEPTVGPRDETLEDFYATQQLERLQTNMNEKTLKADKQGQTKAKSAKKEDRKNSGVEGEEPPKKKQKKGKTNRGNGGAHTKGMESEMPTRVMPKRNAKK